MATPRVFGQQLRLTRNLWWARPALSMGLSIRPPPATMPTVQRAIEDTVFLAPEGRRMRVLPESWSWPMTVA